MQETQYLIPFHSLKTNECTGYQDGSKDHDDGEKHSGKGKGKSSSSSGNKHDDLKSIWDDHVQKSKSGDGVGSGAFAPAATLCKCGGQAGTVCCSGARQYSSK